MAGADCGLAGMVRYVGDAAVLDRVRAAHPDVVGDGRVQAWVVGSGSDAGAEQSLQDAVADDVPLVVDADALEFADLVAGRPAVLTPHAGELASMLGVERAEVEAGPLAPRPVRRRGLPHHGAAQGPPLAGRRARRPVRVTTTGTPWLATAGAGDVLGGVIGALLAAGLSAVRRRVGRLLAARGGRHPGLPGGPIVAGDVARALPSVIATLSR